MGTSLGVVAAAAIGGFGVGVVCAVFFVVASPLTSSSLHLRKGQNKAVAKPATYDATQQWQCAVTNSHSQFGEDRMFLPWVIAAAKNAPGTFVELGALDGIALSNTYILEHCFGWTGLLIEGQPNNFRALRGHRKMRSRSRLKHSAVCQGHGFVNFTAADGSGAGDTAHIWTRATSNKTVTVPCKPLSELMEEAQMPPQVNFLSLDVEGAEEIVLATVNVSTFDVVLAEVQKKNEAKNDRVRNVLGRAGLIRCKGLKGRIGPNELYVKPHLALGATAHARRGC